MYTRLWRCPECGRTTEFNYEDLAEIGVPLCNHDNEFMELTDEEPVQEDTPCKKQE